MSQTQVRDEDDLAELIVSILDNPEVDDNPITDIRTYDDAGIMTRNTGLVINLKDGSEYQITIVKSK